MPVHIVRDDITRMNVDAVVNAANSSLLGGGGVDGAIHRAAGPGLLKECRKLGGCDTGDAKLTKGYNLPSKYVIHTVGPVWHGGTHDEEELLAACYRRSLEIARDAHLMSVAFPLISSGAFGYPRDEALRVAMKTIGEFAENNDYPEDIYLVIFDRDSFRIADSLYKDISAYIDDRYVGPGGQGTDYYLYEDRASLRGLSAMPFATGRTTGSKRKLYEEEILFAPTAPSESSDELLEQIEKRSEATFSERLLKLIDQSGMTDAECYKKANVDRRHFSKIRSNKNYHPKKSTAIAFAVALKLPIEQTQELLNSAGYALTRSSRADLIVEYFIENGRFDVLEINEALFRFNEGLIGS